jgi:hypothetical protein
MNTSSMSLTGLVNQVTAFNTFAALAAAMDRGYTPTLTPHRGRSQGVRADNAVRAELVRRLRQMGYRVWTGSN